MVPLLALAASLAAAQQAWSPLPAVRIAPIQRLPVGAEVFPSASLAELLEFVEEKDHAGLGAEARRARAWSRGKDDLGILASGDGLELVDRVGGRLALSGKLGSFLRPMGAYYRSVAAAQARPVSHAELTAAAATPELVAQARALFERSIDEALWLGGEFRTHELGGEAALDGGLALREIPDPTRPVLRKLALSMDDPEGLEKLYKEHPVDMAWLDQGGKLKKALASWRAEPKNAARRNIVRLTADLVLSVAGDTYTYDPDAWLGTVPKLEWAGRHAGKWHIHPPVFRGAGWEEGGPPSDADLELAVKHGQMLTLVFHPEGFDLYDLSALGGKPELSRAKAIPYRSAAWKEHFQKRHAAVAARRPRRR